MTKGHPQVVQPQVVQQVAHLPMLQLLKMDLSPAIPVKI